MAERKQGGQKMRDSVEDLLGFVRNIKSRDMLTNCTLTPQAMYELEREDALEVLLGENAAVILQNDTENIARLWFYAKDADCIKELIALLPDVDERAVVCDVVGRGERVERVVNALTQVGFSSYAVFQRMQCCSIEVPANAEFSGVDLAVSSDAEVVLNMIRDEFDPLTAHIPSLNELQERIDNGEVFVVRKNGAIVGLSVFKSKGLKMALLDYVIVARAYRREGLGREMLLRKWSEANEGDRYYLWINRECVGAVCYHEKNGFSADGTLDFIMLPPMNAKGHANATE